MMPRTFRIQGEVFKGMFPDERLLLVKDIEGVVYTLILPSSDVRVSGRGKGYVEVHVLEEGHARGDAVALVRLPGESLDGNTMTVRQSELEAV